MSSLLTHFYSTFLHPDVPSRVKRSLDSPLLFVFLYDAFQFIMQTYCWAGRHHLEYSKWYYVVGLIVMHLHFMTVKVHTIWQVSSTCVCSVTNDMDTTRAPTSSPPATKLLLGGRCPVGQKSCHASPQSCSPSLIHMFKGVLVGYNRLVINIAERGIDWQRSYPHKVSFAAVPSSAARV